jgi:hypothetical protein
VTAVVFFDSCSLLEAAFDSCSLLTRFIAKALKTAEPADTRIGVRKGKKYLKKQTVRKRRKRTYRKKYVEYIYMF